MTAPNTSSPLENVQVWLADGSEVVKALTKIAGTETVNEFRAVLGNYVTNAEGIHIDPLALEEGVADMLLSIWSATDKGGKMALQAITTGLKQAGSCDFSVILKQIKSQHPDSLEDMAVFEVTKCVDGQLSAITKHCDEIASSAKPAQVVFDKVSGTSAGSFLDSKAARIALSVLGVGIALHGIDNIVDGFSRRVRPEAAKGGAVSKPSRSWKQILFGGIEVTAGAAAISRTLETGR